MSQPPPKPLVVPVQQRVVATRIAEQYRQTGGVPRSGAYAAPRQPAARFPTAPLAASPAANPALTDARAVLGDMQQILGLLQNQNQQDSPEFREVQELARELSDSMRQARAQIPAPSPVPTPFPAPIVPLPITGAPLQPLKATLGMKGQPGVVSSGPEVTTLQILLNSQGLTVPTAGNFDAGTAAAVKQLQQRHGLAVTGTVGAETRRFLNGLIPHA